eukprot:1160062-Pelagomonas_calceolata.AAC.9
MQGHDSMQSQAAPRTTTTLPPCQLRCASRRTCAHSLGSASRGTALPSFFALHIFASDKCSHTPQCHTTPHLTTTHNLAPCHANVSLRKITSCHATPHYAIQRVAPGSHTSLCHATP